MLTEDKMRRIAQLMDEATRLAQEDGYTLTMDTMVSPDEAIPGGAHWVVGSDDSHGIIHVAISEKAFEGDGIDANGRRW